MFNINNLIVSLDGENQKQISQKLRKYAQQIGHTAQQILEHLDLHNSVNYLTKPEFPMPEFKVIQTESNVCAKILPRKTKAFKCHDCIFQNNSIMCVQCFQESDHKNHIYEVVQVFGGCCDCGDEEKWNLEGFCKKHSNKNLVQEIKKKVDQKLQQQFIQQMGFCFVCFFVLYDEAQREILKFPKEEIRIQAKKKLQFASHFGLKLIQHSSQFNNNSLISNIMTFNLFISKIPLKKFQIIFCPQPENKTILEILLNTIRLSKCAQNTVNLFTQLFPLREFRKQLTIIFMRLHNQSTKFAMSDYNHLTCQLLTSHKMISELVETKQIRPLTYRPKQDQFDSFEQMAKSLLRYFIDIDYLSKLYKDSAQKYLCYHILQGEITSIGYYKLFSYLHEQAINFYGVEEVGLSKLIRIVWTIKNSPMCLQVLQKGMKDLWAQCHRLYKQWNKELFQQETYQQTSIRNIFITYELQFGLLVFTYFQILSNKEPQLTEQQKTLKVINLLREIHPEEKDLESKILQMLEVVNNHLIVDGLTLGHPQTMERYYSFYAFTFKKTDTIISCTLYLYKILTRMLVLIKKQQKSQKKKQICEQFIFKRPFNLIQNIFVMNQFKSDHQSIFDRKKCLLRITYFLHLIIQASQTDLHELILAFNLGFLEKEKYQKMLSKFYMDLLKVYNRSSIKDFKKIVDNFIPDDHAFQKFISTSKQIHIEHGKISTKNFKQQGEKQSKEKQEKVKVQSQLNLFYFKSFKNKLINLSEKQIVFKTPQSSNHFLYEILSEEFVRNLMKLVSSYIDIIVLENGKIKAQESGTLGLLVIQMIKIAKAFQHKPNSQVSDEIFQYFKNLQHKKDYLLIFPEEIVKIICTQSQQNHHRIHEAITSLDKEAEKKAEQRKRKLEERKKKVMAKFKQNQQKFEVTYESQLRKIRDQLQEENQEESQQQNIGQNKTCIICRQGEQKNRFMLMCFAQITDLYEQMIKGKQPDQPNSHLVFKSCGHFIHEQCYQKTKKNQLQEYSMCQLCKSTVNCLFPIFVRQKTSEKEQQNDNRSEDYKQLVQTFSDLYATDLSLRDHLQNAFGEILIDESQIKFKLFESIVSQIVFSALVCKQTNENVFDLKQITVYRNILYAFKIFDEQELKRSQNAMIKSKSFSEEIIEHLGKKQIENVKKIFGQIVQEKKKVLQIAFEMEKWVQIKIISFLSNKKDFQQAAKNKVKLSSECFQKIDIVFNQLTSNEDKSIQKVNEEKSETKQILTLKSQITFYNPPESLSELIKLRGKCPNCQKFTNFMLICLICKWNGCKACQKQSIFAHTRNQHCGNSIYLDADMGNIYFVCKKKYWVYGSIYQDYLGQGFKGYEVGIKLQKFTLNKHRYEKLCKTLLSYCVESTIRYQEYSKKRQFTGLI